MHEVMVFRHLATATHKTPIAESASVLMKQLLLIGTMLAAALAGCLGDKASSNDAIIGDGGDVVANVTTEALSGLIDISLSTPHLTFNSGGAYSFPLARADNNTGYVIELSWTPAQPVGETLALWIRDANAGVVTDPNSLVTPTPPLMRVEGVSPLRLVVSEADLDEKEYLVLVRAPGQSEVRYQQPFDLYITTFAHTDVDAEFTALESA
jgi:hypothetical protein